MEQVIITLDDDVQAGATSPTQAVALTKVTKEGADVKRGACSTQTSPASKAAWE